MKTFPDKLMMMDWEEDEEIEIPSKIEVCGRCGGTGVHDHPAFSNGLTQEDFDEDPDFREEYMAGSYDVQCEECDGFRVQRIPDIDKCNERQKRVVDDHYRAESEARAEARMRERGIQF